jgi:branched-chain amino acid transport system permease protein
MRAPARPGIRSALTGRDSLDFLLSCLILLGIGALPLFVSTPYWRGVLVVALFYALTAMGWNLLGGYAGQFSVAPAAFVLIGMYTSALLAHYGDWSPAASIPMAIVSTGVIGLLLGWLCLRLRGPYLALTTIAFAEVIRALVRFSYDVTRGDLGLSVPRLFGGTGHLPYYYLFFAAVALIQAGLYLLVRSRVGLYLKSIRDDEVAANGRGVNVVLWKTIAFGLSSVICGLAGGLYVHFIGLASPEMGLILQSALMIGMAVIGGMGTLGGPLIGAMLLQPLSEHVREFGVQHMVIFSLLMILIIRFWRNGLYGSLRRVAEGAIHHGEAKAALDG